MSDSVLTITRNLEPFGALQSDSAVLLFPSSLDPEDPMIDAVIAENSLSGVTTQLRIPQWRGPFKRVAIPGTDKSLRLGRSLLNASHAQVVVNLEFVGNGGPFVLDLATRYLHPLDWAKLVLSPDRIETIARINLIRQFDSVVIGKRVGADFLWIETSDLIAAELVALAISEDSLPLDRRHLSPWEDELVQRATELGLGARYPGDIRLNCDNSAADSDVKEVIETLHLRIGIDISTISAQYWQIT